MGDDVGHAPPRPARLEIFDELVHGPDERVRALQDFLGTQLCPTARQFLGSLPTIVRYDDSLHQRVELEPFVPVSGGVSHELHSVVDAPRFPPRKIWLRSPATKSDTGEADDVSFRCGEREKLRTVATDENGRMRLLDGQRMDFVLRHSIVLTDERDLLTREQALDDDGRLRQPLDPCAAWIEAQAGLLVFGLHVPGAKTEFQSTVGQEVHGGGFARHQHGMAEVVVEHRRTDPDGFRRGCGADQRRHRREHLGEMIRHGQRRVAEVFDLASLVYPFRPRFPAPDDHSEPEGLHGQHTLTTCSESTQTLPTLGSAIDASAMATAAPSVGGPGQGGMVTPIADSGSSASARSWNTVPTGSVTQTPGFTATTFSRLPCLRHMRPRPPKKEPDLLHLSVLHSPSGLAGGELEVRHAAAPESEKEPHVHPVRSQCVWRSWQALSVEPCRCGPLRRHRHHHP